MTDAAIASPQTAESFNDRLDKAMNIIEQDSGEEQDPSADPKLPEEAIGEGQEKTDKVELDKPDESQAIEPPISWPSDDKEAFKSLPTWAQERIVARENEREAHFTERARTIAAREREINDIQTQSKQAQEHFANELKRVTQLATHLMPARFSDITSDADYLRLKVEDPQRAAEFETFQTLINAENQRAQQLEQQKLQQKLDHEWSTLQQKYPEFQDEGKAQKIMSDVRKAATDYYGFSPQEIANIYDHRHVQILRDAMAWKSHQANLKAAEGKKVPSSPIPTLRNNANATSANLGAEQKTKIINLASKETDLRRKAEMLSGIL